MSRENFRNKIEWDSQIVLYVYVVLSKTYHLWNGTFSWFDRRNWRSYLFHLSHSRNRYSAIGDVFRFLNTLVYVLLVKTTLCFNLRFKTLNKHVPTYLNIRRIISSDFFDYCSHTLLRQRLFITSHNFYYLRLPYEHDLKTKKLFLKKQRISIINQFWSW